MDRQPLLKPGGMAPEKWQRISAIFQSALAQPADRRASYLDQACGDDEEVRGEVEALLESNQPSNDFIDRPALDLAAKMIADDRQHSTIGSTVGHYKILELISAGGMGEVYLARDTMLERQVALKLLPTCFGQDSERLKRFEQEARLASALAHPNICVIYGIGATNDGGRYIAMEYVDGVTLRQRIAGASLGVSESLDIIVQVATALARAHEVGVIHRDVKPENIMLARDGHVKVVDFGIAKLSEPARHDPATASTRFMTMPGTILGTVQYMSPEQARGFDVDARTDIWSLGVVLYEMLAGRAPFEGETASDAIAAILEREPRALQEYALQTPTGLQLIVDKALRKDRQERYQTGKELLNDLRQLKQEFEIGERTTRSAAAGIGGHSTVGVITPHSAKGVVVKSAELKESIRANIPRQSRKSAISKAVVWITLGALLATAVAAVIQRISRPSKTIESLAVLPFVYEGDDPQSEYLADGITESLINDLSNLSNLKIIAHSSVLHYKAQSAPDPRTVVHDLKVQAVLMGRIVQQGDNLLVSAELIDGRDNSHIWGHQYPLLRLSDVFVAEKQIAKDVSQELRLQLGDAQRQEFVKQSTQDLKAFDYYTQGRLHANRRTREDLYQAASFFQRAIDEDKNYALAYAGLAEVYGSLGVRGYMSPAEGLRLARENAQAAVTFDDSLAQAHMMLGECYVAYAPYDFPKGEPEITRAIQLNPNLAAAHMFLGLLFLRQNRLEKGLSEILKARELDPFSPILARHVASYYLFKRDYPRALQELRQTDALGPAFTTTNDIEIYIENGAYQEALTRLAKEKAERKDDPLLIFDTGMVYAAEGRRSEALGIIRELERYSEGNDSQDLWIAKIYAMLNEKDQAFKWLQKGLATGALGVFYQSEPAWDTLRKDPRFDDLLGQMNIPQ